MPGIAYPDNLYMSSAQHEAFKSYFEEAFKKIAADLAKDLYLEYGWKPNSISDLDYETVSMDLP